MKDESGEALRYESVSLHCADKIEKNDAPLEKADVRTKLIGEYAEPTGGRNGC